MADETRKLFGTDGIRGVANRDPMTAEMALRLGQAVAQRFQRAKRGGRHRVVANLLAQRLGKRRRHLRTGQVLSGDPDHFPMWAAPPLKTAITPAPRTSGASPIWTAASAVEIESNVAPIHGSRAPGAPLASQAKYICRSL